MSETIPGLVAAAAVEFGERLAVADGATRLTYGELHEQARAFGGALVAAGIETGERVGVWAFNSAEWIVAALGTWQAGAVLVPVNTRFKGREAVDILHRSRARALVTVTDFLGTDYVAMLQATEIDLPDLHTIVAADGFVYGISRSGARSRTQNHRVEPWDGFMARAAPSDLGELDRRVAELSGDDTSDILFTSGTTGVPKGVVMTHSRTLGVATDWVAMTGLGPDDRYLMINPYFHMFGLKAGILACVAAGAAMFPEETFDVDRALARVAEEG